MRDAVVLFVRTMLARAYPRVIGLVREPTWVIQETVLPILSVSAYAFVYRAMGAENYIPFVILGGAMTAFWLNVLWSMGAQFYWDRDEGNLELYIIAPAPLSAVLAGMALGGMFMTMTRAVVILLAGVLLFGVRFDLSNGWELAGVFALTLLALYGLGMVFASTFLMWGRQAWHLVNLLQEPIYLLSGLNYPVRTLGNVVAFVAGLLPLTLGVDALRQILFGAETANPLMSLEWEVGLLAALAAGLIALALWCLRLLEKKARVEGSLTLKGQ